MGKQKGAAERSKYKVASSAGFANGPFFTGSATPSGTFFTGFGSQEQQLDQDLDPRLRVALRKIMKKDSTTKVKACDELLDLMKSSTSDEAALVVHPLLVTWPRYYQKVATEIEPRVRAQGHQVTVQMLKIGGKQSAPFLKSLIPSLLFGTCDEYSISSSTSLAGFKQVFPTEEKQVTYNRN